MKMNNSHPIYITDAFIEALWDLFDTPVDDDGFLEEGFLHWPARTNREEIWTYFDGWHTKGVAYLLNDRPALQRDNEKVERIMRLERAIEEGNAAHKAGKTRKDNPYFSKEEFDAWHYGFDLSAEVSK